MPGDPNNGHGTHIKLGNGDGTLSIIEFGYAPQDGPSVPEATRVTSSQAEAEAEEQAEIFNKTAVGFWRYSAKTDDLSEVDVLGRVRRRHNQGAYFIAERSLFVEHGHPAQGLAGFVRLGNASEDINTVDWTASIGLRYHGLLPGRDDDIAGIAVSVNHAGDKFRRLSQANGDPRTESNEIGWEVTYHAQINPWLALQPNAQYIVNPSGDYTLKNVWIVGFRTEVVF